MQNTTDNVPEAQQLQAAEADSPAIIVEETADTTPEPKPEAAPVEADAATLAAAVNYIMVEPPFALPILFIALGLFAVLADKYGYDMRENYKQFFVGQWAGGAFFLVGEMMLLTGTKTRLFYKTCGTCGRIFGIVLACLCIGMAGFCMELLLAVTFHLQAPDADTSAKERTRYLLLRITQSFECLALAICCFCALLQLGCMFRCFVLYRWSLRDAASPALKLCFQLKEQEVMNWKQRVQHHQQELQKLKEKKGKKGKKKKCGDEDEAEEEGKAWYERLCGLEREMPSLSADLNVGIAEILFGLVAMCMGGVHLAIRFDGSPAYGCGLWGGVLLIVSGCLGCLVYGRPLADSGKHKRLVRRRVILLWLSCFVSAAACVVEFVVNGIALFASKPPVDEGLDGSFATDDTSTTYGGSDRLYHPSSITSLAVGVFLLAGSLITGLEAASLLVNARKRRQMKHEAKTENEKPAESAEAV